ncbi:hypothetical protein CkaCkLH20_12976 [Colletotrichum karsti]|uniref:Probable dipeptidyl-aminopeptidase B n=1 Tax=Colletotrichum karsti TaxID=1095194 RepID=A0A9P6HSF7_9PEZI|nr:uncharacterized protein CkaCkLH20_12976 [Colletotrichum karsti]KAF9869583.1 hypothetical protein CkaCkLH20_12976 [Colletotrichum karsti]
MLSKERPSKSGKHNVTVNFVNETDCSLSKYWIDFEGKAKFYGKIGQGKVDRQRTFAGHVWRLADSESNEVKAIYVAPEDSEDSIVIDESTMAESASQDAGHSTDDEDDADIKKLGKDNDDLATESASRVFVKGHNIWLRDSSPEESKLTSNATEEYPYDESRIIISPDEKFIVVWQYTPEEDHKIHLRESVPADQLEPKVRSVQYLKPGDRVRVDRPRLFNIESKSEVATDDKLFRNPYKIDHIGWSDDSSEYRFLLNERGHQHLRVIGMKTTGEVRALIEESSETFIDYSGKLYYRSIENTDEMLWASERDGYSHLYLFDLKKGILKLQITKGQWNFHSTVDVDEKSRRIIFSGYGMAAEQDPYHAHLARVNFDGEEFKILTGGDGSHRWTLSPDKQFFVDTWSRVDALPQSVLRSLDTGEQLIQLEGHENGIERLLAEGWMAPEKFSAPGRDGRTLIYGIIIRPSHFDPSNKYPVLEDIYAGPHNFHTPKQFSALSEQRQWAEQGYVVVILDGMGTNWRSKEFHDVCYKNLKDAGFPDRIAWIKSAAETRPWMDISRVGVMGGSAGGQSAVAALIHHHDFYKVAIADSGCHDNRMDKIWWNEQWMGYPVDKSYEDSSNVVHADKLRGALMLIVGELDDNVDPASTFQLINALNEADKDYEFLFIPGAGHCSGRRGFALRRQERFLRQHLLGL